MSKKGQIQTMYERIPAVAALNRVPGFDPVKLLRRTISPKTKEEVWRLDLPYKKLWFRLANPNGKIRLNALRVTEQLAIYEAQVFLDRDDQEPVGSFTVCRTKEDTPDGQYIQEAQKEAMNEALSDAGYGLQFADVSMDQSDRYLGSEIPVSGRVAVPSGQTAAGELPIRAVKNEELPVKVMEQNVLPIQAADLRELPDKAVEKEELPVKASEPDMLPVSGESVQRGLPVQRADTLPVELPEASETIQKNPAEVSSYTRSMPVETILGRMTFEEALEVVVDVGTCNGKTIAQVMEKRPASLKYYVYGGYKGDNNILKAAAKLALDYLDSKKAG